MDDVSQNFHMCNTLQVSQLKEKLRLGKIPLTDLKPMEIVHIDLFKYAGKECVSMKYQVSTFTCFSQLPTTDTERVLKELDALQGNFGRVSKIVSNNGPQFLSQCMAYCKRRNIQHELSSLYSPSSNYTP